MCLVSEKQNHTLVSITRRLAIGLLLVSVFVPESSIAYDENQALIKAVQEGQIAEVKSLLNAGADVNAVDQWCWTVLMRAAWAGNLELVTLLLDKGADVNAKTTKDGETALVRAAQSGKLDTVNLLAERGAVVTLTVPAALGDAEWVERLLANGAAIDAKDRVGDTAVITATQKGHLKESTCFWKKAPMLTRRARADERPSIALS
jgi:ankyrin repeat protein